MLLRHVCVRRIQVAGLGFGVLRPQLIVKHASIQHQFLLLSTRPIGPPRRWSPAEVESLRKFRAQGPAIAAIVSLLGRTEPSVRNKLCDLQESYAKSYYTTAEDQQIRDMMQEKATPKQIQQAMPLRSYMSLKLRRQRLRDGAATHAPGFKWKPWTIDEQEMLLKLRGQDGLSFTKIATHMQRSAMSLREKYRDLRTGTPFANTPRSRNWTQTEVAKLKEMRSGGHSLADIASALSRSVESVRERGLNTEPQESFPRREQAPQWTAAEFRMVKDLRAQSKSFAEIAKLLPIPRTPAAVRTIYYRYGKHDV